MWQSETNLTLNITQLLWQLASTDILLLTGQKTQKVRKSSNHRCTYSNKSISEIIQWIQVNNCYVHTMILPLTRYIKLKLKPYESKFQNLTDLKTLSILGDIMNAQAVAGLHAHAAANLNHAGMGNQAPARNQVPACNLKCVVKGLIALVFVGACVGTIYLIEYQRRVNRKENRRILFEKFEVETYPWKTLQDNPTSIENVSNDEDFQATWSAYFKAKSYLANYTQYGPYQGKSETVKEFSVFSKIMEQKTRKILKDTFGERKTKDKSMNIAKRIAEENKSSEGLNLKTYLKIMQDAYIKRVAKVFELKPEDLDTTCKVLGTCHFLKPAPETKPESKIIEDEF